MVARLPPEGSATTWLYRLTVVSTVSTYLLIILGGITRVSASCSVSTGATFKGGKLVERPDEHPHPEAA